MTRRKLAVAAAVTVALAGCGETTNGPATSGIPSEAASGSDLPAVEGTPPTASDLAGIWRVEDDPTNMARFGEDGTFAVDDHGTLDLYPPIEGTFEVADGAITVSVTSGGACDGDSWTWQAGLVEDGRLNTVFTEAGSGNCYVGVGTEWTFISLSPASAAGAEVEAESGGAFDPLSGPQGIEQLAGLWLLEGGGHLLRMTPTGSYALDDRGLLGTDPADEGTFEVTPGKVTFVSEGGSSGCAQGDRSIWTDVRFGVTGRSLHGDVVEDECSFDVGREIAWVQLAA